MKLLALKFFAFFFVSSFAHAAAPPSACESCEDLKRVETKVRTEKKPDYDALQLTMTTLIDRMAGKTGVLNDAQIARAVSAMDASVEHDPAAAIVENNFQIIQKNRAGFDREVAKLPKAKATRLTDAMKMAHAMSHPGVDFEEPK